MLPGQRPYRELHWLSRMPGAGITAVGEPRPPEDVEFVARPYRQPTTRFVEAGALAWLRGLDSLPETPGWLASLELCSLVTGQVSALARRRGGPAPPTCSCASWRRRASTAWRSGWRRSAARWCCPASTPSCSTRPPSPWRSRSRCSSRRSPPTRGSTGYWRPTGWCGGSSRRHGWRYWAAASWKDRCAARRCASRTCASPTTPRPWPPRCSGSSATRGAAPASERPTAARCWSATSSTASASASARSCAASASASQSPELWPQPLPHQLGPALAEVDAVVAHLHAIHAVHVAPARAQEAPEVEQHHPVPVGGDEAAEDLVQPFAPGGIVARGGQRLVQAGVWLVVAGHVQHGDAPARQRHQVVGELQLAVQVLPVPRGGGLQHATVDLVVEHLPAPEHHQGDVGMEGGGLVAPARRPGGALGVDRLHAAGQDDGSAHQTAAELRVAAKDHPANSPPGVVEAEGEADRVADQVDPEGIARVRPAGRLAG